VASKVGLESVYRGGENLAAGNTLRGMAQLTIGSLQTYLTLGSLGSLAKAGLAKAGGIANPVPNMLARAIPGPITPMTIGPPGASDVFVTAADDIMGMNARQIAPRLDIQASDTFTVMEFSTPVEGLASPVSRGNLGFIGRGRTAGGAREFVIPNGQIPPGATIRIVK